MAIGDEKFNITLKLAGTVYPISIARKDEEMYRRAEVAVNELVAKYKSSFRVDQSEQYFAFAALDASLKNVSHQMTNIENQAILRMEEIERELDEHIENLSKK